MHYETLYVRSIATRYMLIIASIALMAQHGDAVGDLASSAVKDCISAMVEAGAEAVEIRQLLHERFEIELQLSSPHQRMYRQVLEEARCEVEQFLSQRLTGSHSYEFRKNTAGHG